MTRYLCRLLFLCFLLGTSYTALASDSLVIAGTGDSQTLLRNLAVLYEKEHPNDDIIVPDSVGSGGGIKALINGTAGLGRTARALKAKERGHDLTERPIALSPIVFVANPDMTLVKNITTDDILKIYSGVITNWRELGGDDHKIYPVDREPGDSSRNILEAKLRSSSTGFKDIVSKGKVFYTTPETAQAIAKNRYTIGYLPLSVAQEAQLHIFSLDSVYADKTSLQNRQYPLASTFYLIEPPVPGRLAKRFVSFLQEPGAQGLMLSSGVIPVGNVAQ